MGEPPTDPAALTAPTGPTPARTGTLDTSGHAAGRPLHGGVSPREYRKDHCTPPQARLTNLTVAGADGKTACRFLVVLKVSSPQGPNRRRLATEAPSPRGCVAARRPPTLTLYDGSSGH